MIRSLIAAAAVAAFTLPAAHAAGAASAPAKAPAKKTATPAKAAPAKAAEPAAPLTEAQLEVAKRVLTGTAECEFKEKVEVAAASEPGHFKVTYGKNAYSMVPQETTTGAVVLVDKARDIQWLQIPAKSMLLDQKAHKRLVTECQVESQKVAAG